MAHIEQSSTSDGTSKNNDSHAKSIKIQNDTTSNDDDHHANETRLNDRISQFDFNFSESSSLSLDLSPPTETTTTTSSSSYKSQIIPLPAKAVTTTSSPSIIDLTQPSSSSSSIATTLKEPAPPSFSVMIPIPPASVVVDRNIMETTSATLAKPPSAEPLPEYSAVVEDMPPMYDNFSSKNIDPFQILGPIHPQQSWPVTKRLYIYGYLIWPLWIIGLLWLFAADKVKRQWARRCAFNGSVALMIFIYVIVAALKTGGIFG